MATYKHDIIVGLIVRKIRTLGLEIEYLDGRWYDVNTKKYPIPPKIINHRPDVIAMNQFGCFAIGEAKTESDISSKRTKQQAIDYSKLIKMGNGNYLIYGVPLKVYLNFKKILSDLGIYESENVIILKVPEELVT